MFFKRKKTFPDQIQIDGTLIIPNLLEIEILLYKFNNIAIFTSKNIDYKYYLRSKNEGYGNITTSILNINNNNEVKTHNVRSEELSLMLYCGLMSNITEISSFNLNKLKRYRPQNKNSSEIEYLDKLKEYQNGKITYFIKRQINGGIITLFFDKSKKLSYIKQDLTIGSISSIKTMYIKCHSSTKIKKLPNRFIKS